jgi:hypothetical protein
LPKTGQQLILATSTLPFFWPMMEMLSKSSAMAPFVFTSSPIRAWLTSLKIADVRVTWCEGFQLDRSYLAETRARGQNGPFKVLSRRHFFHLQSVNGIDFAVINSRTAKALRGIYELPSVFLEAFLINGCGTPEGTTRTSGGRISSIPASINIYGSFEASPEVGNKLFQAGIFLQYPEMFDTRFQYYNPHSLRIPDWVLTDQTMDSGEMDTDKLEDADREIRDVLDSLDQSGCLKEVNIDGRISTTLLP